MSPKILLVEDEPSIADNILYALRTEGFEVTWCATAREALETFAGAAFRLVVLDVGLPDGNGFDVCRELRGGARGNVAVPIIFVTARKDEIDRVVGLEIGADDYVVKPFSPRELSARVKAVLRRVRPAGDAAGDAEEVREIAGDAKSAGAAPTLNPSASAALFAVSEERMEIRYRAALLPLSRYEYRLLKLLLAHPGRVFSRDELMERVWDDPGSSLDRTVDAHIKTLRAKLHAVFPEAAPIRTYRGVGYFLAAD